MFELDLHDRFEVAKARQAIIISEIFAARKARQQAAELLSERKALRRFHVMFRVRRWLHRWLPGVARVML
ncbi:MAG: hypothetical protein K0R39_3923 [Symbiobacteriaceae bacterium]|jgi:hypothetical protein|nr:hypothetical protein [Symbiobacteriaceae bacterium]